MFDLSLCWFSVCIRVLHVMRNRHSIQTQDDCVSFVCGRTLYTGVLESRQPLPTFCACDSAPATVNATLSPWLRGHSASIRRILPVWVSFILTSRWTSLRQFDSRYNSRLCASLAHRPVSTTTPVKSHTEKPRAVPVRHPIISSNPAAVVRALTRSGGAVQIKCCRDNADLRTGRTLRAMSRPGRPLPMWTERGMILKRSVYLYVSLHVR